MHNYTWSDIVTAWAAWVTDPESNPPVQWYNHHSGLSKEESWENWDDWTAITKTLNGLVVSWRVKPVLPKFRIISDLFKANLHGPDDNNTTILFWEPGEPMPIVPAGYDAVTDWTDLVLSGEPK